VERYVDDEADDGQGQAGVDEARHPADIRDEPSSAVYH
jgi:hypothetical protein